MHFRISSDNKYKLAALSRCTPSSRQSHIPTPGPHHCHRHQLQHPQPRKHQTMKYATHLALSTLLPTLLVALTTATLLPGTRARAAWTQPRAVPQAAGMWSAAHALTSPFTRFSLSPLARPFAGELYAWVDSRQATSQCSSYRYCRAKAVMAKTPAGTIISAGYMIYTTDNVVRHVDAGTASRVSGMTDAQAIAFAKGVMIDLQHYDICGVTVEDLAAVIKSSGAAAVAACPQTGEAGCDQTAEVARC